MRSPFALPQHWVVRAPNGRYLASPLTGQTVAAPWPCGWNSCVKADAEAIVEKFNSAQSETVQPWQVEPLDMAPIAAASVDLAGVHLALPEAA